MNKQLVVLVTGATTGIGRTVAERLTAQGYRVFGTGRAPAAERAGGVELLALDVTSTTSVQACVAEVQRRAGRLDVLVNNVGAMLFGAAEEVGIEELQAQLDLNLLGTARMIAAALPLLRARRGSKIINLSSLGGLVGLPYLSAYAAGKFALEGYSEALRLELLTLGIYVVLVEPGGVRTESLDSSQRRAAGNHPAYGDRAGQALARQRADQERGGLAPQVVAEAVARIVASPRPRLRHTVGAQARAIALIKRLAPFALFELLLARDAPAALQ